MIDSSNFTYHHYRSLIKQVSDNDLEMDVAELESKIYKAYRDNLLSDHHYDSLCDLLCAI